MAEESSWHQVAEVGSLAALRLGAGFYRVFGRRLTHLILHPASAYFVLRHRYIRDASRAWLGAVREARGGAKARVGLLDVYRHVFAFGINLLDRVVLWGGSFERFEVEKSGSVALLELARTGRGGILVGAHLGSFDVLRLVADQHRVVVNVLMFTDNAAQINALFERLDPRSAVRVLSLDPGSVDVAFSVRACIERGEFVAILADRTGLGGREHPMTARFLGRPAHFAGTPFLLAALLGCPLLLALGVRTGPERYEAIAHPLSAGRAVPRREREAAARAMLEEYVAELERHCLRCPTQWFNFYDFWASAS